MATAPSITARAPTAVATEPGEHRFLLRNVGWAGYVTLLDLLGDDGPRMNYAHGDVELMSPLHHHERLKRLLGYMIEAITDELDIRRNSLGSTTFKKQAADRGLEPDECFYIANAGRIRDQKHINLDVDPPPDLCIEVEITNSLLDRLDIDSAIGVPEIWRHDGEELTVVLLGPDGRYAASGRSASFPYLPMAEVARFLREYDPDEESRWGMRFRAWVREVVAPLRDRGEAGAG